MKGKVKVYWNRIWNPGFFPIHSMSIQPVNDGNTGVQNEEPATVHAAFQSRELNNRERIP